MVGTVNTLHAPMRTLCARVVVCIVFVSRSLVDCFTVYMVVSLLAGVEDGLNGYTITEEGCACMHAGVAPRVTSA